MLLVELTLIKLEYYEQPTTNNQQPTTNNQQPTTNNQQPTTNNQQPIANFSLIRGKLFLKHEYVHEARVDSMLLIDAVKVDSSKTVLEVGVGMGVGAVFLSGIAKSFTGTDLNPHALEVTRRNVMLNGDDRGVELIQGDCFEPVKGRKFDVILTNPPQLPTPVDRERSDWTGKSNNAGHDGREILNRIIGSAANYLNAGGKLYILHLSLSDIEETRYQLGKRGFQTDIITERVKSFGSLSFERKDHIRSINSAASFHEDSYQLIVLECQLIG